LPMDYNRPVVDMKWARATAVLLWVAVLIARAAGAPQTKTDPATKTTLDGVYSAEQAARGEKLYGMTCLGGCHNSTAHKGPEFKRNWAGHLVDELFARIADTMPDDNPGALTAKESADVVGYLLKSNGMPAGKEDLGTDRAALGKIRIEMPPAGGR